MLTTITMAFSTISQYMSGYGLLGLALMAFDAAGRLFAGS